MASTVPVSFGAVRSARTERDQKISSSAGSSCAQGGVCVYVIVPLREIYVYVYTDFGV